MSIMFCLIRNSIKILAHIVLFKLMPCGLLLSSKLPIYHGSYSKYILIIACTPENFLFLLFQWINILCKLLKLLDYFGGETINISVFSRFHTVYLLSNPFAEYYLEFCPHAILFCFHMNHLSVILIFH